MLCPADMKMTNDAVFVLGQAADGILKTPVGARRDFAGADAWDNWRDD